MRAVVESPSTEPVRTFTVFATAWDAIEAYESGSCIGSGFEVRFPIEPGVYSESEFRAIESSAK